MKPCPDPNYPQNPNVEYRWWLNFKWCFKLFRTIGESKLCFNNESLQYSWPFKVEAGFDQMVIIFDQNDWLAQPNISYQIFQTLTFISFVSVSISRGKTNRLSSYQPFLLRECFGYNFRRFWEVSPAFQYRRNIGDKLWDTQKQSPG